MSAFSSNGTEPETGRAVRPYRRSSPNGLPFCACLCITEKAGRRKTGKAGVLRSLKKASLRRALVIDYVHAGLPVLFHLL